MSKNTPRVCCPWASFPYKETLPIPHPFTLDLFVFLKVDKSKWTRHLSVSYFQAAHQSKPQLDPFRERGTNLKQCFLPLPAKKQLCTYEHTFIEGVITIECTRNHPE